MWAATSIISAVHGVINAFNAVVAVSVAKACGDILIFRRPRALYLAHYFSNFGN